MTTRYAVILMCLLLSGAPYFASAQELERRLPPGGFREIAWQDPYPGRWQTLDVTSRGIQPGADDLTAKLQTLLDGLNAPTIVYFPPGAYRFNKISVRHGDIIIKGAGPKQTVFRPLRDGTLFEWWGDGGKYDYGKLPVEYQPRQILADVPPGGATIEIKDTTGLHPGDMVLIEEDLDKWSYDAARRSRGGVFLIAVINGNKVDLDLPLAIGLDHVRPDQKNALVSKLRPIRNIGLEGVRIKMPAVAGEKSSTLFIKRVQNGYIRNVDSTFPSRHHVEICYSRQIIIEHCLFDEAKDKGGGGYGYGVEFRDLSTLCLAQDNIFRDVRHAMATEAGANYCIFAYNLNVDRMRDLAHSPAAPPECRDEKWLNDRQRNGITSAFITADVVAHGNYPHQILFEGNVFYNGCVDRSHTTNGPHFFFRNCALGQPPKYGWWQEGAGIVIMGENDNQVIVGNQLLHGSTILLQKDTDRRTTLNSLIGANVSKGQTDWADLKPTDALPPSLYLKQRPTFWPANLPWPAFGPDIAGSASAKIPVQLRYEQEAPPVSPLPAAK